MKILLYSILLLLPFVCNSQTGLSDIDTTTVGIDNKLTEVVLYNFLSDATKYGLDSLEVVNHIKHLDGIWIESLSGGKLGATVCIPDSSASIGIRGVIFIDSSLIYSYEIFKLTIYHELGHWFGLDHTKRKSIMMKDSRGVIKVLKNWDKYNKKLMRNIKRNNYSYPSK